MIKVYAIKEKVKAHLGDLWWYTIIVFAVQHLVSVINAFVGLWLVPEYIPQKELGAVLPLVSLVGVLGLPLTIIMIPFMKFLTKYMAQEEYGKVKALLRDVFVLSGIILLLVSGLAYFFMPLVFERMRIENGSLSMLLICSGVLGALVPVFSTALQALKNFRIVTLLGIAGTGLRFMTLLICLPIRGLSGYFVGSIVPSLFSIIISLFVLRRRLDPRIKIQVYWNADWKPILKYTAWIGLLYGSLYSVLTIENMVIRHRLPDVESAGYYMISRFAEILMSFGLSLSFVLFPIISDEHERRKEEVYDLYKILKKVFCFSLLFVGILFPIVYFLFWYRVAWHEYLRFMDMFAILCIVQVIRGVTHCYVTYETARSQVRLLPFLSICYALEVFVLVFLTRYGAFASWMPMRLFDAIAKFNPCRLSVILGIILSFNLVILLGLFIAIHRARVIGRSES
jgi:O-antigen/teichoic acid export membrane protein